MLYVLNIYFILDGVDLLVQLRIVTKTLFKLEIYMVRQQILFVEVVVPEEMKLLAQQLLYVLLFQSLMIGHMEHIHLHIILLFQMQIYFLLLEVLGQI